MTIQIISRADAIAKGIKRYFTGTPCKRGHICERYANDGHCAECRKLSMRAKYRGENFEPVIGGDEREEARKKGQPTYSTGKPCSRGHIGERYTSGARCVVCSPMIGAAWLDRNPDRRKRVSKEYFERNKSACIERCARWFHKNRKKFREYMREEYRKNPAKYKVHCHNRRARKLSGGRHSPEDILDILKSQRSRCAYCAIRLGKSYHVDYIIPLARGGSNERKNLQILCAPCNQSKSAKDPIDFARQIGMLL